MAYYISVIIIACTACRKKVKALHRMVKLILSGGMIEDCHSPLLVPAPEIIEKNEPFYSWENAKAKLRSQAAWR